MAGRAVLRRDVTQALYTGDDGESYFEDVEIPLEDRGVIGPGGRPRRSLVVTLD